MSTQIINCRISRIEKLGCILLAYLVVTNGICNYLFGEIISEALALGATLIFFATKMRFNLLQKLFIPASVLFFYISISIIMVILSNEWARLLFLYTYFFFLALLFIPAYDENYNSDNSFFIKTFIVFACISSLYALAQRYGAMTILPLETENRATGLSRSSLNLTGCMLAIFGMGIFSIKDSYKKLAVLSIVFLGMLAAGGRGGIISALILIILVYFKKLKRVNFLIGCLILSCLIFLFEYDWFLRSFGAFNFVSDESNIDRLNSYSNFFSEFDFMGKGVGTTSPAAGRFIDATGFESSMLNMIYEIGVPFGVIIILTSFTWFKYLCGRSKKLILKFLLGLLPVIAGQQLFGIPSAFCALMLALYVLISYRKPVSL
jgi:hypothetical protein